MSKFPFAVPTASKVPTRDHNKKDIASLQQRKILLCIIEIHSTCSFIKTFCMRHFAFVFESHRPRKTFTLSKCSPQISELFKYAQDSKSNKNLYEVI